LMNQRKRARQILRIHVDVISLYLP
jgi:hypothetical protein